MVLEIDQCTERGRSWHSREQSRHSRQSTVPVLELAGRLVSHALLYLAGMALGSVETARVRVDTAEAFSSAIMRSDAP